VYTVYDKDENCSVHVWGQCAGPCQQERVEVFPVMNVRGSVPRQGFERVSVWVHTYARELRMVRKMGAVGTHFAKGRKDQDWLCKI
jgi:hypothetical protein